MDSPPSPKSCSPFDGLIVGSVEANYFTQTQQDLIREFANRRGGGILFLGGRFALAEGGYAHSPLAELLPVQIPENKGTFHRDFSNFRIDRPGPRQPDLPPGRRSRTQRRALGQHAAARQL
jgi:hypothetical protein